MFDFERWMHDMGRDCLMMDNTGELSGYFERTRAYFDRFHDDYYTAKNKGSKTACQAMIIDFCKLLPAFTATKWQIELERSSVETLMWSSLYYCMNEQDWRDFYFMPKVNLCNDRYRIDFGVYRQEDHRVFFAVTCDAFSCRYPDGEREDADARNTDIEFLKIADEDIYRNPLKEAEKILNHIRGNYFERPLIHEYANAQGGKEVLFYGD